MPFPARATLCYCKKKQPSHQGRAIAPFGTAFANRLPLRGLQ